MSLTLVTAHDLNEGDTYTTDPYGIDRWATAAAVSEPYDGEHGDAQAHTFVDITDTNGRTWCMLAAKELVVRS